MERRRARHSCQAINECSDSEEEEDEEEGITLGAYKKMPISTLLCTNFQAKTASRAVSWWPMVLCQTRKATKRTAERVRNDIIKPEDHSYSVPASCKAQTSRRQAVRNSKNPG
jgi:hypothetical protein